MAHALGLHKRTLQVQVTEDGAPRGPVWTYPGMGARLEVVVPEDELNEIRKTHETEKHKLGQWMSTAICGNDILSSVLYSSGIVVVKAGKVMPIPLILVSVVLYFFRFIYEEVVTAIPLNGGSYNVLLNTTSKRVAAFGAALGIISYMATGVVSATSAVSYLGTQVHMETVPWTIGLLFIFAVLNVIGMAESAGVALVIFTLHVVTLSVLVVSSLIYFVQHTSIFSDNMHSELPDIDFAGTTIHSNYFTAIFFGYAASLLGITGFESSAQFVEDQEPGVFRKTLRNMWGFSTFFNAVLAILALGVLPVSEMIAKQNTLLAEMGRITGGHWLEVWVSVDAFIVLSGAVLTSYVGITGLVRRLSCDQVLPAFLMKQNPWRKTNHNIILTYFLLASSLVLILNADTTILAGVYTYAFLGLMSLFAFGCMALKVKRKEIPRDVSAPWWTCIMGFTMVVIGILGNLLGNPSILMYFAIYVIVVASVMVVMMERVQILQVLLVIMKRLLPSRRPDAQESPAMTPTIDADDTVYEGLSAPARDSDHVRTGARGGRTITKAILNIKLPPIIYFCKHPDMTIINKAILYVRRNEQTQNLRIVHVSNTGDDGGETGQRQSVIKEFENIVALFDHIYPKLKIDFVSVQGEFEPAMVIWVSEHMSVPINMIFIAQPGDKAVHRVSMLGVRVITG